MAMERPLIMGVHGESAEIVRTSGSGVFMGSENEHELVEAVLKLADDREYYQQLCSSGRDFVSTNYSRDVLAAQFLKQIEKIGGNT